MKPISVAIISSRPNKLERILNQLKRQTVKPNEILIINTSKARLSFSKQNIKILNYKFLGFASLRNLALQEVKNNYILFLDDDCHISKNLIENYTKNIESENDFVFYLGKNLPYHEKNVYSISHQFFYEHWINGYSGSKFKFGFHPIILDTKNILLNKTKLREYDLSFNEFFFQLGGEDTDLGMQIASKRMLKWTKTGISVKHENPITFSEYFRKYFHSRKVNKIVESRWHQIPISKKLIFNQEVTIFLSKTKVNLILKIQIFLLIYLTQILGKVISWYESN